MKLDENIIIVFKNDKFESKEITITVKQLLENTTDDFYEWLDNTEPCTSASCNNENQNFCDCGSTYDDYTISEILVENEIIISSENNDLKHEFYCSDFEDNKNVCKTQCLGCSGLEQEIKDYKLVYGEKTLCSGD